MHHRSRNPSKAGDEMTAAAPERIHHWLTTQLSIARFYGGLTYQGHHYLIAYDEPGQPLVRSDVIKREAKERKAAARKSAKAQAGAQAGAQEKLI